MKDVEANDSFSKTDPVDLFGSGKVVFQRSDAGCAASLFPLAIGRVP